MKNTTSDEAYKEALASMSEGFGVFPADQIAQAFWNAALEWVKSGQDPVAWMVKNGVVDYQLCCSKPQADALCLEMQKRHDLSGSLASFHVVPLYATHPAPEQPVRLNAIMDAILAKGAAQPAESVSELQKDAPNLLFALQDAWPYVHKWCTVESVRHKISGLIRKYGDFGDIWSASKEQGVMPVAELKVSYSQIEGEGFEVLSCELPVGVHKLYAQPIMEADRPQQPAVDSNSYVQPVPDHCDRIIWCNTYYNLPIKHTQLAVVQQLVEALESVRDRIRPGTEKRLKVEAALKAAKEQWK